MPSLREIGIDDFLNKIARGTLAFCLFAYHKRGKTLAVA